MRAHQPWRRADTAIALAFGALAFATRFVHRGRDLFTFDSGTLASGIVEYDFASGYPHPPFYPLTMAMGKVLAVFAGPVGALVWMAVVAAGVMAAVTYATARHLTGRLGSSLAAAIVILSPTSLQNGIVALSYSLEGAASAMVGFAAVRVRALPTWQRGAFLGLMASFAVGIRPSGAIFLAPLALWAVWGQRKAFLGTFVAGLVATVAWFIPMLHAGGGWHDFVTENRYQSHHLILSQTVFDGRLPLVGFNLQALGLYGPLESAWLSAVAGAFVLAAILGRGIPGTGLARGFLASWTMPSLMFYLFVYVGWPIFPNGYLMVLVPPAAIGAVMVLGRAHGMLKASRQDGNALLRRILVGLVVAIAAWPITWTSAWPIAVQAQRDSEAWEASWDGLEEVFPPNETALMAEYGMHWARLNHGNYLSWNVQYAWNETDWLGMQVQQSMHGIDDRPPFADALDGFDDPPHPIPTNIRRVVLFEGHPIEPRLADLKENLTIEEMELPNGHVVRWFSTEGLPNIEAALAPYDDNGVHKPDGYKRT